MAQRLTDLIVTEASLVDSPANPHARVLFWKVNDPDRGQSRPPHTAGDAGHGSGREEETDTDDVSIVRDPDDGRWYLEDSDGKKVGGPFEDKQTAQRAALVGSAESKLDTLAKARQASINKSAAGPGESVTYAKAYSLVLKENPALYEEYKLKRSLY